MSKEQSTGESSTLDMTKPDDCLRWALGALELVENGLRNRRKLQDDDVEMSNLRVVKTSIEKARDTLKADAKDAARYRWMRHNWASVGESYAFWPAGLADWQLDEQIDKEIK